MKMRKIYEALLMNESIQIIHKLRFDHLTIAWLSCLSWSCLFLLAKYGSHSLFLLNLKFVEICFTGSFVEIHLSGRVRIAFTLGLIHAFSYSMTLMSFH